MSSHDPAVLGAIAAVMVAYLGVLVFIGWRAARVTHGGEDFHLAGRTLGAWAAGISSTASSESGWVTLGAVGMTYAHGVSGLWYAPGCLLGYLVNLYVVAPRIRRLSRDQGSLTLTDVLTRRWGDPRNVLRVVSVAIILASMMCYVAAQMTAAGKAFASTLGIEGPLGAFELLGRRIEIDGYTLGVLLGALVITIVTSIGGFRGVAWTDLFQGLLMALALAGFPLYALARLGGVDALAQGLAAADPGFLTATGRAGVSAAFGFIVGELGIGLGYPGMPHVVTRYMAARDDEQIRRLRLIAILWGVVVFYGAGLTGLVARVMLPDLADGERALMVLSLRLLPAAVAGLMLAAVISAILSTVSSQLLVAASAVSYDVIEGVMGRRADDRRSLRIGRITVAAVGLLGILFALSGVRLVFWFVLAAWSALGASFGPLVLLALGRSRVSRHGALAGMLTGAGVTVAWKLGRDIQSNPEAFRLVPWVTLAAGAALLAFGAWRRFAGRGEAVAIVASTAIVVGAWGLVQWGWLGELYELVPAFFLALAATLAVSAVAPAPGGIVPGAEVTR